MIIIHPQPVRNGCFMAHHEKLQQESRRIVTARLFEFAPEDKLTRWISDQDCTPGVFIYENVGHEHSSILRIDANEHTVTRENSGPVPYDNLAVQLFFPDPQPGATYYLTQRMSIVLGPKATPIRYGLEYRYVMKRRQERTYRRASATVTQTPGSCFGIVKPKMEEVFSISAQGPYVKPKVLTVAIDQMSLNGIPILMAKLDHRNNIDYVLDRIYTVFGVPVVNFQSDLSSENIRQIGQYVISGVEERMRESAPQGIS